MAALFALASATTFGIADFLGGVASRRTHVLVVAMLSQVAGLAVLAVVLPWSGVAVSAPALAFGAVAGIGGAGGLVLYFRALSIGPMGVTAPVAAVVGAVLPIGVGLFLGERPGPMAWVGIGAGVVAVSLASRPSDESAASARGDVRAGLLAAVGAGAAFGLFFVALDAAPTAGGMWPLLAARTTGLTLLGGLVLRTRPGGPTPRGAAIGLVSGLLDMVANVLFLLATQSGMLVLVAVLTSLYPVGVVLLARTVLRERLSPVQWGGVGLAIAATVMIAI